jgi:hypothetical protein
MLISFGIKINSISTQFVKWHQHHTPHEKFSERLTIGTFNLNNLCLPNVPVLTNKQVMSSDDYERKVEWTADQLRRMNADVVAVQEVIHLKALQDAVTRSGVYVGASVIVGPEDGIYPTVGIVSRLPVSGVEVFSEFPKDSILDFECGSLTFTSWTRPVLKVEVEAEYGQRVAVFVVHLKSMRPDMRSQGKEHDFLERAMGKARSLVRRTVEAVALRALILPYLRDKVTCLVSSSSSLNRALIFAHFRTNLFVLILYFADDCSQHPR